MTIASKKFAVAALAGAMTLMTTAAFAGDFPSLYPQGYKGNGTSYEAEKASCKATGTCKAACNTAAKPAHHKKHHKKAAAPAAAPAAAKPAEKPAEKPKH